ncbi:MAG: phosphate ABC transporter permease subunit PstC, partial [Cytophagales bacterium]|nr:phosphate ABC transporter permease subunit PstC [Cytophagales bacterium]
MKSFRSLFEKFIEGLIYFSGNITTIVILLIIIFLFKEGSGLFNRNLVEEGYVLAINPNNPLKELTAKNVRNIFEKNTTNWKEIGGPDAPVVTFTIDDLEKFFTEDQLSSFDSLPYLISGLCERE